jgi:hypothetical protein
MEMHAHRMPDRAPARRVPIGSYGALLLHPWVVVGWSAVAPRLVLRFGAV